MIEISDEEIELLIEKDPEFAAYAKATGLLDDAYNLLLEHHSREEVCKMFAEFLNIEIKKINTIKPYTLPVRA